MKREIIKTSDGSKTIRIIDWDEQYHSVHGALQEAVHVFIQHLPLDVSKLSVFEMGFGTGLNALLTVQWAQKHQVEVDYLSIEAYPVNESEWKALEYEALIPDADDLMMSLHGAEWEQEVCISDYFRLTKQEKKLADFGPESSKYDVVFYDAFGPRHQPGLWTQECFEKMFDQLKSGGMFLTYCAKGQVRRDLQAVGFEVHRLPGPPGKREMLQGIKP